MKAKINVVLGLMLVVVGHLPFSVANAGQVQEPEKDKQEVKLLLNGKEMPTSSCLSMQDVAAGSFSIQAPDGLKKLTLYLVDANRPVKVVTFKSAAEVNAFNLNDWLVAEGVAAAQGADTKMPSQKFNRIAMEIDGPGITQDKSVKVCEQNK